MAEANTSYRERVMRAVVELESDLDRRVPLDGLARTACLSPFHFHRVFGAVMGESVAEYARRLRLERAAHDLRESRRSITTLGREAGYARPESFTRAFSRQFGATPKAYRAAATVPPAAASNNHGARRGRIELLRPLRVAFIRHVGPYANVPPVFSRIREWLRANDADHREPLLLGLAHDIPGVTPEHLLRFDCCIAIDERVRPGGEVAVQQVLGGHYAVAVHRGPFATLHETYAWLARDFIPSTGRTFRKAAAVELYITPPEDTPPDEQLTEILLPVGQREVR